MLAGLSTAAGFNYMPIAYNTTWGHSCVSYPLPWASVHWLVQCTLECHWLTQCTLGYQGVSQRILVGYIETPLEKFSWNFPTLECHWRNSDNCSLQNVSQVNTTQNSQHRNTWRSIIIDSMLSGYIWVGLGVDVLEKTLNKYWLPTFKNP